MEDQTEKKIGRLNRNWAYIGFNQGMSLHRGLSKYQHHDEVSWRYSNYALNIQGA